MATVATVFRKEKINAKGLCPIHFRIIKHRKVNYVSTGILIKEEFWDFKNNKIKSKYPNSARLNNQIAQRFAELNNSVLTLETNLKSITGKQLKEKIYGGKPTEFFTYAEAIVEQYQQEGKIGTYDRCKTVIKKFKEYKGMGELLFQDITPDELRKYENYLRKVHNNAPNTIHSNLKFIRRIINEAVNNDIIEPNQNPFLKHKIKTVKTSREYLNEEELDRLCNLDLEKDTRLRLHRDMFVFCCNVGGIRISDLLQLQWKNFDGKHITFIIKKTGTQQNIKVPDKGIEIISQYAPKKPKAKDFLFPAMDPDINLDDSKALDNAISGRTAYINKNLKILADLASIDKNISFHVSRHTWATRALTKGMEIHNVSKLMGHSQIRETQIYAKIINKSLDDAMDLFN